MPMKLPKGFQRRKSSGNALDENPNPPQPSFRVFERAPDGRKSFDGGNALKRMTESRPMSDGQYREFESGKLGALNRGSGGTQNSASTGGLYDTSSSARFSSSSTLPSSSSLDAAQDDLSHAHPKVPQKAAAPSGFSLRAAGRTFSFGGRKSVQPPVASPEEMPLPQQHTSYTDIPAVHPSMRPRAMTELSHASGSTATPPKLLDTDFGNEDGDGFGDMFAGLGAEKRRSRLEAQKQVDRTVPSTDIYTQGRTTHPPPAPIHLDRSESISPAPYSGTSQSSRTGLMSASPQQDASPFNRPSPNPSYTKNSQWRSTPSVAVSSFADRPAVQHSQSHQQWQTRPEQSPDFLDEDTRLAMQYMGASEPSHVYETKPRQDITRRNIVDSSQPRPVTLYDGENQDNQDSELSRSDSITTTPRAKKATLNKDDDGVMDDLDFQEMAISADRFQTRSQSPPLRRPAPPKTQGKVMTPAQFERYKKEQESLRNQYATNKSDSEDEDGDGDKYEDDDEEERNKEMARQRRRQDAQMSVYRQQMMKVTGEQPPMNSGPQRPSLMPTMSGNAPASNDRYVDGKDDDEDEDIPLGILAAHGFPSKERAPSHLNRMGSQPNIRYTSETYPPPPASASGASMRDSNGNMPAFARNLPKDPFFGAGLVNPTDRQSLAFGAGAQSVYGGSQAGAPNPGGLVGVIAKEERARALRRGSPNAAAIDASNAMAPQPPGMMMGGAPNQDQQAQMQMSQQMTQMMQMQMQWMQQMMAMQGMPGQPGMPPMPGMPGMPGFQMPPMMPGAPQMNMPNGSDPNLPRPTSMGNMSNAPSPAPPLGARSMSMLTPDSQAWNTRNGARTSGAPSMMGPSGRNSAMSQASFMGPQGGGGPAAGSNQHLGGYAPSLAPSERSNIGLAPRYRPVSTMPGADGSGRTSTMGSSALNAWDSHGKGKAAATVRVVPARKNEDDEDDDEGWEEMRKKREKKRSLWRGKKADRTDQHALDGVFIPSMD